MRAFIVKIHAMTGGWIVYTGASPGWDDTDRIHSVLGSALLDASERLSTSANANELERTAERLDGK